MVHAKVSGDGKKGRGARLGKGTRMADVTERELVALLGRYVGWYYPQAMGASLLITFPNGDFAEAIIPVRGGYDLVRPQPGCSCGSKKAKGV